jgi:hypothetical protein
VVRHPNWRFAEDVLASISTELSAFDVDQINGLSADDWTEFQIDDRDPKIVTRDLLAYCAPVVSGMLVVVTLLSFRGDVGPFFVRAERLNEFSSIYPEVYDDAFVAGDLFVLSPATGVLVVVHHNGLVAIVRGKGPQPS